MKKRVLSMVLACLLVLSAAACGKEGAQQNGQGAAQGGQDAAQDTESGTDEPEEGSVQGWRLMNIWEKAVW